MDKDTSTLVGVIEKAIDTVPGKDGKDGKDGFSPTVSVSKTDGITTLTVTDKNGTTSTKIYDGAPGEAGAKGDTGAKGEPGAPGAKGDTGEKGDAGEPGAKGDRGERGEKGEPGEKGEKGNDGFSPVVTVNKAGNTTTVTVTDKNGTTTAQILNGAKGDKGDKGDPGETGERGPTGAKGAQGQRGEKGDDGFSPLVTLSKANGVTTVTVTDKDGTTSAQILDGAKGDKGDDANTAELEAALAAQSTEVSTLTATLDKSFTSGANLTKNDDLDTVIKSGQYKYSGSPANKPSTQTYGVLLVYNPLNGAYQGSSTYAVQVAMAGVMYFPLI